MPARTPEATPARRLSRRVLSVSGGARAFGRDDPRPEQVANFAAPGERAFSGALVTVPDGTSTPDSTIAIDLGTPSSDSPFWDDWAKINTLQTRRLPRAEFAAQKVGGVLLPLPATGEWQAQLSGLLRIHSVDREMAWSLTVTRNGAQVHAKGATRFRFGDNGMAVPASRNDPLGRRQDPPRGAHTARAE